MTLGWGASESSGGQRWALLEMKLLSDQAEFELVDLTET